MTNQPRTPPRYRARPKYTKKAYPSEFTSYAEMRRRLKGKGLEVHPAFATFQQFMQIVGPKPSPQHTLNRELNDDPGYSPESVSWASKTEQANNRGNTIFLHYTGSQHPEWQDERLPLTSWATRLGIPSDRLRRRRRDGWTDNEVIEGIRTVPAKSFDAMSLVELLRYVPWPAEEHAHWEARFREEASDATAPMEFYTQKIAHEGREIEERALKKLIWEPPKGDARQEDLRSGERLRDYYIVLDGVTDEQVDAQLDRCDQADDRAEAVQRMAKQWHLAVKAHYEQQKARKAEAKVKKRFDELYGDRDDDPEW